MEVAAGLLVPTYQNGSLHQLQCDRKNKIAEEGTNGFTDNTEKDLSRCFQNSLTISEATWPYNHHKDEVKISEIHLSNAGIEIPCDKDCSHCYEMSKKGLPDQSLNATSTVRASKETRAGKQQGLLREAQNSKSPVPSRSTKVPIKKTGMQYSSAPKCYSSVTQCQIWRKKTTDTSVSEHSKCQIWREKTTDGSSCEHPSLVTERNKSQKAQTPQKVWQEKTRNGSTHKDSISVTNRNTIQTTDAPRQNWRGKGRRSSASREPSSIIKENEKQKTDTARQIGPESTRTSQVASQTKPWAEEDSKQSSRRRRRSKKKKRSSNHSQPVFRITCDGFDKTCEEGETCLLCNKDLSHFPSDDIPKFHDDFEHLAAPEVSILLCGHVFHSRCLDNTTPADQARDPPCLLCFSSQT